MGGRRVTLSLLAVVALANASTLTGGSGSSGAGGWDAGPLLAAASSVGGSGGGGLEPRPALRQLPVDRVAPQYDPVLGTALVLDPDLYRSSSQGPELINEPLTPELSEIDRVIDMATRTYGWQPIIPQFYGNRTWAWQHWRGTILEHTWPSALLAMVVPAALILIVKSVDPSVSWISGPEEAHRLFAPLHTVGTAWNYLLTLTTFVTTFFVGHAHAFWRKSYSLARVVQGRINDIALLTSAHAARSADGHVTADANVALQDISRELRLAHVLFWADVCYRRTSETASIRVLLSADGLQRMRARGLITPLEHATLLAADAPPSRWYLIVIEWITARIIAAHLAGIFKGGDGFEQVILEKCCELRAACMGIPDELAARMPLAYVHFSHFLVDMLLLIAPFALYPRLGVFSILTTGIITLFYRGLIQLSKSFLDPFGNRRVSVSSLSAELAVPVLLGETNAGSLLWPQGAMRMPFDTRSLV